MNGVGVKRDVRHDAEFRKRRFHGAHGTGNEAVRVVSGGGIGALVFLADDGERGNGGDAEGDQFAAFFQEKVDGKAGNAGHGRDGFPLLLAFADEDGLDEVVNGQGVFAGEASAEIVLAVAAFAGERVGLSGDVHGGVSVEKGGYLTTCPAFLQGRLDSLLRAVEGEKTRRAPDFSRDAALNPR